VLRSGAWLTYSPVLADVKSRRLLRQAAKALEQIDHALALQLADRAQKEETVAAEAAIRVLSDLAGHGWRVRVTPRQIAIARPDQVPSDDAEQRERVRAQHIRARDDQLRNPAVRAFIQSMETRRIHSGRFVSIFSLLRDGRDLAPALATAQSLKEPERFEALRQLIKPYLQTISGNEQCEFTGFRLGDIWRYFRYTWANHYVSVPGRSMMILVRDAAAPNHPIIGIAALGSAVVQNTARDRWIGWEPDVLIPQIVDGKTLEFAKWLVSTLDRAFQTTFVDDFLADRDISYSDLRKPSEEAIARLESISRQSREQHHRGLPLDHKRNARIGPASDEYWRAEAASDLFKSKRAALLATLMRAKRVFASGPLNHRPEDTVRELLKSATGKQILGSLIRKAKSETVGISIADITVCGAIAPYNHLLGGKLVAMLLASPQIVASYRDRYSDYTSIIASSMAGRAIKKPPMLTALATTSLYGVSLSQYTRIAIPAGAVGGSARDSLRYEKLGETLGYGSFHFSVPTRHALSTLCAQSSNGALVNFIFGEGVSPRFRALRDGLDELGVDSDELLNHGSPKISYGVRLASNCLECLLGMDIEPKYYLPLGDTRKQSEQIARWWTERWLSRRIQREDVLSAVAAETLVHPIRHKARVTLPDVESDQLTLFP
jgi:Domain of unknown function (DUF4338)